MYTYTNLTELCKSGASLPSRFKKIKETHMKIICLIYTYYSDESQSPLFSHADGKIREKEPDVLQPQITSHENSQAEQLSFHDPWWNAPFHAFPYTSSRIQLLPL